MKFDLYRLYSTVESHIITGLYSTGIIRFIRVIIGFIDIYIYIHPTNYIKLSDNIRQRDNIRTKMDPIISGRNNCRYYQEKNNPILSGK